MLACRALVGKEPGRRHFGGAGATSATLPALTGKPRKMFALGNSLLDYSSRLRKKKDMPASFGRADEKADPAGQHT